MKTTTLAIAAAMAAGTVTRSNFAQTTRTVCPDPSCDYSRIQDAVDASADGDTIEVGPGVYSEVLSFHGKAIRVVSTDGPSSTFIDKPLEAGNGIPGGHPSSPTVVFESGEGRDSVLDGFTIRKGTGRFTPAWPCDCDGWQLGGGIFIANASPLIRNCVVRENSCFTYHSRGGGVYVAGGSPRFEGCDFLFNGAGGGYGRGGGAWIAGDAEFFDCDFQFNTANSYHYGFGGAIWVEGGSPLLDSVRIVSNVASHGVGGLRASSTTRLTRVYLSGNSGLAVEGRPVDMGGNVLDGDCDNDGVPDSEQIASGQSPDLDGDGVPDHCACLFGPIDCCAADVTFDGFVDGSDLSVLLGFWGSSPAWSPADITRDGVVDGADLSVLLGSWGECP
jgi:hypothetical protein